MAETPTLAELVSINTERARRLASAATRMSDPVDAAYSRGQCSAFEIVARELTEVIFPAPEVSLELAQLREENGRLRRQRDKVAGWHGIDLSELEREIQ